MEKNPAEVVEHMELDNKEEKVANEVMDDEEEVTEELVLVLI